ncbi:MAG: hypothetical protein ACKVPX_07875 [Myxococcaceae bacterium]
MARPSEKKSQRKSPPRNFDPTRWAGVLVLGAAGLLGVVLLVFAFRSGQTTGDEPPASGGIPPASEKKPPTSSPFVSQTLTDAEGRPRLTGQSEQKRNQILVVDLFHEILGRYPNFREQRLWFELGSPANQALQQMRRAGRSEAELANYVAGMLMDGPEHQGRVPAIADPAGMRRNPSSPDPSDGAAVVGAMLARAVGYGAEIPRAKDAELVRRLNDKFKLAERERNLEPMTRMMRDISGSSDVGEHFLDDTSDLKVEATGIQVALRRGRLIAVNGSDVPGRARYIAVVGFDGKGDFIVRDPTGRLPSKISSIVLMAFLQKPGASPQEGKGFWLDMPGARRTRCIPGTRRTPDVAPEVAAVPPVFDPDATFTGVIPGAQQNLSRLKIPPGEHSIRGSLSLSANQINEVLASARSPAAGTGDAWVKWGTYYNIDPAYALAFFRRESSFGAHPRWIGRMDGGRYTKNVGNIRYRGRPNPQRQPQYGVYDGFRSYATWDDGIQDWYKLLSQDSNYAGLHTVEQILPVYAPTFENDTDAYVTDVVRWVKEWRGRYAKPVLAGAQPSGPTLSAADVRLANANELCPD